MGETFLPPYVRTEPIEYNPRLRRDRMYGGTMFERCTEELKRLIGRARREAQRIGHTYLGTGHLLLVLLDDPYRGEATAELLEVDADRLRAEIRRLLPEAESAEPPESITLSLRMQSIVDASVRLADRNGHGFIGPEHILTGLVCEQGGVACRAIVGVGGRPAEIVDRIVLCDPDRESAQAKRLASSGLRSRFTFATCCTDVLSRMADPVVGRESQIARLRTVLARRRHGNAVVVGEPGVGKTAVVHGLVTAAGQVFELDVPLLLAGTENRGDLEYRIHHIAQEALRWSRSLFIEDLHFLANGVLDEDGEVVRFCLRQVLEKNGGLIGSISTEGYEVFRRVDPAFLDCFQPVWIEPATEAHAVEIVAALRTRYLDTELPDELLPTLVELAQLYMQERALPGSAVDLLDELGVEAGESPIDEEALIRVTAAVTGIRSETIRKREPGRSPWLGADGSRP